jgi:hypothetical protein
VAKDIASTRHWSRRGRAAAGCRKRRNLFIEAKPRGAKEARLADAIFTLTQIEERLLRDSGQLEAPRMMNKSAQRREASSG